MLLYRLRCSNYKFYDFYNASFIENKQTTVIYIGQLYNKSMCNKFPSLSKFKKFSERLTTLKEASWLKILNPFHLGIFLIVNKLSLNQYEQNIFK